MGKNIRITALLLTVSLLLNMVVLPVHAEDTTVPTEQITEENPASEDDPVLTSAPTESEAAEEDTKETETGTASEPTVNTEAEQLLEEPGQDNDETAEELLLIPSAAAYALTLEGEDGVAAQSDDYPLTLDSLPAEQVDTQNRKISLSSGSDLVLLSNVNPALYQDYTLEILSTDSGGYDATQSVTVEDGTIYSFRGLGNSVYPFSGSIGPEYGTHYAPLKLNRALFQALSDSATIGSVTTNEAGVSITLSLMLGYYKADGALQAFPTALLADTVTHGSSGSVSGPWYVNTVVPDDTTESNTPPLIGTMGEGAGISLSLKNTSVTAVKGNGHAGYLCASMGAGASLTLAGWEGTMPEVTAASDDAGSLVGTMAAGAALSLGGDVTLTIPNVTASNGSAGGIVGSATDANIPTIFTAENVTISGKNAGGLIGSYTYTGAVKNSLSEVSQSISGITVSGSSNAGGVFGVLNNTSDSAAFTISSPSVSTTALSGNNVGGLIGQYSASNLAAALNLTSPSVSSALSANANTYGGLVGRVDDDSKPAYLEISTASVTTSGDGAKNYGGLVAALSKAGHMLKVGAVKTTACKGSDSAGGLVGNMPSGVLWLSGQVETGVHSSSSGNNRGWILGNRGNTLVYSTIEWTPKGNGYNDIGNWGQVLQIYTGSKLDGLVTYNSNEHTVTVNDADKSCTIGETHPERDFAAIALRFQLENQATGALKITDDITDSSLKGDEAKVITLNADVNLSGTGVTGFQWDYSSATVAKNVTLNGNNHSISFPDITVYCGGSHNRQGLFAKAEGLTVTGVTLKDGRSDANKEACGIQLSTYANDTYAGALVAESSGTVSLSNVKSNVNITKTGSNANERISGLIAYQNGGSVIFSGCEWNSYLKYKGSNACYMGGFLARTNEAVQITVESCTIRGSIEKTGGDTNYSGGLIGSLIDNQSADWDSNLTITGLTADGVTIISPNAAKTGGILGWEWMTKTTQISGVTVKNCTLSAPNARFGGLVYKGSGYWKVYGNGIKFEAGVDAEGDAVANTFTGKSTEAGTSGLLLAVGDKQEDIHRNALYLEILNGAYTIASDSVNLIIEDGSKYFDEIVGQTKHEKGNGIVSIATSNGLVDAIVSDGKVVAGECNSYQNKTKNGSEEWENPNTRYYYNLDSFRTAVSESVDTPGEMVLLSAYKHCFSGLQQYFYYNSTITGTINLTGYSYYPVPWGGEKVTDADITFDFEGLETAEENNKCPHDRNCQHYGMHTGIFTEVVNGSTTTNAELHVSGLTLSGTVGGLDGNYGALIRDNTQGSGTSAKMVLNISNVKLDGIRVYPAPGDGDIWPLLIHSIGSYSTLNMSGVETVSISDSYYVTMTETTSDYAASSLIGPVGSSTGQHIQLTFSDMALDGRTEKGTDKVHNTYRTIFRRALFLEEFCYTGDSSGTYNFTQDVKYTLGQELSNTDSGRNPGDQYCFFDDATKVCSIFGESADPATCFADYRRYVYQVEGTELGAEPKRTNYELDINLSRAGLEKGCGTYSHPYIIENSKQLQVLSEVLQKGTYSDGWKVNLDVIVLKGTFADQDNHVEDSESHRCKPYTYRNGNWSNTVDSTTTTLSDTEKEKVLNYLRNAYYQINSDDITLSGSWTGLGASADLAFCGVIDGNGKTITINRPGTAQQFGGLIKFSMGSVVKDLTIAYSAAPTVTESGTDTQNTNTSDASFFGGVVGWCLGGDTIIDNVTVTYTAQPSARTHLAAVGGYVGMVGGAIIGGKEQYGGGVVFRGSAFPRPNIGTSEESTSFYVNPYVGRVLDGYAISEDKALDNTNKNYKIPNIAPRQNDEEGNPTNPYLDLSGSTITVKNADGLWLLSAIANSGSAFMEVADNWAYSYGKTRCGDYDMVGKVVTNNSDLADESYLGGVQYLMSGKSNKNSVPYLVAKYAPSGMQNLTGDVTIELSGTGNTFDMSTFGNGFRGIGASYGTNANNSSNHRLLTIAELNGNSNTVKLAQERKEYTEEKDNWTSIGSGLFVLLKVPATGFTASDLTLKGSTGITYYSGLNQSTNDNIKDGNTIIGSLETGRRLSLVGAGMLAGNLAKTNQTISGLSLTNVGLGSANGDKVTVNENGVGSTNAGGLVGALWNNGTITSVTLTDCTMDNVEVSGRMNVGGLIGYVKAATVSLNYSKDVTLKNIGATSTQTNPRNDNASGACGVGGLIGYNNSALTINASNATGLTSPPRLTLEKLTVKNSVSTDTVDKSHAGGLVGLWVEAQNGAAKIINVTMAGKIEITGGKDSKPNTSVGGLAGAIQWQLGTWNDDSGKCSLELSGVRIASGKDSDGNNSSMMIKNGRQVGGLFGMTILQESFIIDDVIIGGDGCPVTISNTYGMSNQSIGALIAIALDAQNLSITNTQIINTDVLVKGDGDRGAGLVVGFIQNGPATIDLRNLTLRDSVVVTQNENLRTGMLYGKIDGSHAHTITGTNILVKNCVSGLMLKKNGNSYALYDGTMDTFTPSEGNVGLNISGLKPYSVLTGTEDEVENYTSDRKGILGGDSGGKTVKLVGVSIQQSANTLPMKDFGTNPGTGSYVIRSDYTGAANGVVSNVTTKPVSPLTIEDVGTLTGDGAAFDGNTTVPVAQKIWDASTGKTRLNLAHYSQIKDGSRAYLKTAEDNKKFEFTDFKTAEQSQSIAVNFPVVKLLTNSSSEANKILYSCISLLSNWEECTTSGGTVSDAPKSRTSAYYDLSVTGYKWNGSSFTVNSEQEQTLSLTNGTFILNSGKFDNTKGQFNLIHVEYKDPTNASNTVYDLYIPVVVQKLFGYTFHAAAKVGTDYKVAGYNDLEKAVVASHGEPVTALLTYTYQWTEAEWNDAIKNGQDLRWNYQHSIRLNSYGDPLPADTKLTLVDRSTDMAYYLKLNGGEREISFADFKDVDGKVWEAQKFCDKLSLQATKVDPPNGTYVEAESVETADITVGNAGYRLAEDADKSKDHYKIEVKDFEPVSDQFYLTIQTPEDSEALVNIDIECPKLTYALGTPGLPSEIIKFGSKEYSTDSENKLILGSFFNQELTVTTTRGSGAELIASGNASIDIAMTAEIRFKSTQAGDLFSQYAKGQELLHCFELKLNEYNADGSTSTPRSVAPGTGITAHFKKNGSEIGSVLTDYVRTPETSYRLRFPGEITAVDVGAGLTLEATVTLSYSDAAIVTQFPTRAAEGDRSGVAVQATSNLAYSEGSLVSSPIRSEGKEAVDENNFVPHFYRDQEEAATLYYCAYEDHGGSWAEGVSELGINGREKDEFTIETAAIYNYSGLSNAASAQTLKCTVTLLWRNGSYDYPDYTPVIINEHLSELNVRIRSTGSTTEVTPKSTSGSIYYFDVSGFDSDVPVEIPITLKVKTGEPFESSNNVYANYRVMVEVELQNKSEQKLKGSNVSDYIVYTNAKINHEFVFPYTGNN